MSNISENKKDKNIGSKRTEPSNVQDKNNKKKKKDS